MNKTFQLAPGENLFLQSILDSVAMSIISTDLNGNIISFSNGAEQLLGYRADEVVGEQTPALFHDPQEIIERAKALSAETGEKINAGFRVFVYWAEQGKPETREWTYIRKDGTRIKAALTVSMVRNRNNTPLGYVGIAQDISARVKAEQEHEKLQKQVQKQMAELQRINSELTQFAYVASHDLRAPLRGVKQLADWISSDLGDNASAEVQEQLRLLGGRVQRMDKLLIDLLDYSRAGKLEGEMVEVNLAALCRDVFELSSPPPTFKLVLKEPMPVFKTLAVPLEQVLRNLVSNALKHHDQKAGSIIISATLREEWVDIKVQDDGPGIPPELHEKAFAMFQTLKPRDSVEGSGMGLALVRRIVHGMGGFIAIHPDSSGGRGTCIHFVWPNENTLRSKLNEHISNAD